MHSLEMMAHPQCDSGVDGWQEREEHWGYGGYGDGESLG